MRQGKVLMSIALLLLSSAAALHATESSAAPIIKIEPRDITVVPGEFFTVNITISDVTPENSANGIYGWEVDLGFNSSVVEAVRVSEGPFLKTVGSTWWTAPKIDNSTGLLVATDLLFPYPGLGAFGSGVLANATFKVMAQGKTTLDFLAETPYVTKLRTYNGAEILPIEFTATDATFEYPLFRDVTIGDVAALPAEVVAGEVVSINVSVRNNGKATESFDVSVAYNATSIETKHVTDLASEDSLLLSFGWHTKDVAEGNYAISASASAVSGEANATNNVFHDGFVRVKAAPPAFPWLYVAVGIGAAVVVVAGAFLYMRRRKS